MSLAAALTAPRVHHQLLPADTLIEEPYGMLEPTVREALIARGYRFVNRGVEWARAGDRHRRRR